MRLLTRSAGWSLSRRERVNRNGGLTKELFGVREGGGFWLNATKTVVICQRGGEKSSSKSPAGRRSLELGNTAAMPKVEGRPMGRRYKMSSR